MLAWTIYISFIGVLVLMLLPKDDARAARAAAMLTALLGFFIALMGFANFTPGDTVTLADVEWIPSLGIRYHLAADGISLTQCDEVGGHKADGHRLGAVAVDEQFPAVVLGELASPPRDGLLDAGQIKSAAD